MRLRKVIIVLFRDYVGVMVDYSTGFGSDKPPKITKKIYLYVYLTIGCAIFRDFTFDLSSKTLEIPSHIPSNSSRQGPGPVRMRS